MRLTRIQSEADVYHVVARGNGRQVIFESDRDRERFLTMLELALDIEQCELYAWCLMSNHVHLLLHAPIEQIAALMRRVLGQYAMGYNSRAGRVGHLFQGRFSSEPVNDEAYLLSVIRYIHQNPVKAGLSKVENYPWSSYREYVFAPRLCSTELPMAVFGSVEGFVSFHQVESADSCLDVSGTRTATRGMPDENAMRIAKETLAPLSILDIKGLEPTQRNIRLAQLKHAGLTVRQIERLTGIGRGIIQRARL